MRSFCQPLALAVLAGRAAAFPGPKHLHPTLHFAPPVVSESNGWHDVARQLPPARLNV